ncbi:MAG: ribosome small subunit-dependent GTPase A [Chlamydiia bacterium]|nr:ribosome small subunit-dependent GTPase A [Chlamydiia bacterium]
MSKFDDYLDFEEDYQPRGKRESRKERRESQTRDRSKYKKTDQDQRREHLKAEEPPLGGNHKRGRVLSISPEIITVAAEHQNYICTLKGALKKERTKQKNLIAVGDFVHFEVKSIDSGAITHVEKRTSFLARADNLSRRKQQLIAVNIDQVFIVMSVVAPKLKPLLIDRYILSALKGNMKPIILINKIDLLSDPPENIQAVDIAAEKMLLEEFREAYTPLKIPIVELSVTTGENLDQLKTLMHNQTSVFSGQSGVGKSSLINATLGSSLPIGDMVEKTRKGSHTTTTAELIPLQDEGFCVDTPGIKSFGVYDINPEEILLTFPDFAPFASECKFPNCTHIHEPDCAIKEDIETKKIHPLRYASYTTLLQESPPKEWE